MASSAEAICNIALLRVGQGQTLDSLDESTAEAQACDALYEHSRDSVLAAMPWRFATRRATLALLEDVERDGWDLVYTAPADCLATRYLYPGTRNPGSDELTPFALEDEDGEGPVILTDLEDAVLVYTAKVTVVTRFPPLFVDALAWRLASELALALPIKPQVGLAMEQNYQRALARAAAADMNQGQGDLPADSEFIRAR